MTYEPYADAELEELRKAHEDAVERGLPVAKEGRSQQILRLITTVEQSRLPLIDCNCKREGCGECW